MSFKPGFLTPERAPDDARSILTESVYSAHSESDPSTSPSATPAMRRALFLDAESTAIMDHMPHLWEEQFNLPLSILTGYAPFISYIVNNTGETTSFAKADRHVDFESDKGHFFHLQRDLPVEDKMLIDIARADILFFGRHYRGITLEQMNGELTEHLGTAKAEYDSFFKSCFFQELFNIPHGLVGDFGFKDTPLRPAQKMNNQAYFHFGYTGGSLSLTASSAVEDLGLFSLADDEPERFNSYDIRLPFCVFVNISLRETLHDGRKRFQVEALSISGFDASTVKCLTDLCLAEYIKDDFATIAVFQNDFAQALQRRYKLALIVSGSHEKMQAFFDRFSAFADTLTGLWPDLEPEDVSVPRTSMVNSTRSLKCNLRILLEMKITSTTLLEKSRDTLTGDQKCFLNQLVSSIDLFSEYLEDVLFICNNLRLEYFLPPGSHLLTRAFTTEDKFLSEASTRFGTAKRLILETLLRELSRNKDPSQSSKILESSRTFFSQLNRFLDSQVSFNRQEKITLMDYFKPEWLEDNRTYLQKDVLNFLKILAKLSLVGKSDAAKEVFVKEHFPKIFEYLSTLFSAKLNASFAEMLVILFKEGLQNAAPVDARLFSQAMQPQTAWGIFRTWRGTLQTTLDVLGKAKEKRELTA